MEDRSGKRTDVMSVMHDSEPVSKGTPSSDGRLSPGQTGMVQADAEILTVSRFDVVFSRRRTSVAGAMIVYFKPPELAGVRAEPAVLLRCAGRSVFVHRTAGCILHFQISVEFAQRIAGFPSVLLAEIDEDGRIAQEFLAQRSGALVQAVGWAVAG